MHTCTHVRTYDCASVCANTAALNPNGQVSPYFINLLFVSPPGLQRTLISKGVNTFSLCCPTAQQNYLWYGTPKQAGFLSL